MKKAVIFHGTQGSPEGNWFRWLEGQLQERGFEVWLPHLPHAERPSLREWLDFVHANAPFALDEDTLVVGHSSGAILALLVAQENKMKLKGVVCVSVFHDNALKWDANSRLFDVLFNWKKIKENVDSQIVCIHSKSDPYVPLEQAEFIAQKISAELIVFDNEGHFNLEADPKYRAFPPLFSLLEDHMFVPQKAIQIVDANNNPIGKGLIRRAQQQGQWHRVVYCIVVRSDEKILLQKRLPTMGTFPDCWDHSAAGHVDYGEDNETAALRELKEEIGYEADSLPAPLLYKTQSVLPDGRRLNRFVALYRLSVPDDMVLRPQQEEVGELRWLTEGEVRAMLHTNVGIADGFVDSFKRLYGDT